MPYNRFALLASSCERELIVLMPNAAPPANATAVARSEEHTSELQSQSNLVCRLLLEKKKTKQHYHAAMAQLMSRLLFNSTSSASCSYSFRNSTRRSTASLDLTHVMPVYVRLSRARSF